MPDLAAPPSDLDRFCIACGYNLRAIESDRCPECGTTFDAAAPAKSQIPWSYRASLGRWRAFWRTVNIVTARPKQLATEIHRPVSLVDAIAFRRQVAWIAALPWIAGATFGYFLLTDLDTKQWLSNNVAGSIAMWIGMAVLWFSVWLWSFFCTGVASYFFHPRRLPVVHQNRAVALSYYACAPAVYWPVVGLAVALLIAGKRIGLFEPERGSVLVIGVALLVSAVIVILPMLLICGTPMRLLTATTQAGRGRWAAMGILLPVAKVLLLILTVGVINLGYWLIASLILSLI